VVKAIAREETAISAQR